MSEHQNQVALFNYLRTRETMYPILRWIHAIPNGGHRHVAVAKRMKAEGTKSGVWDIFIPVPVDEYAGMYIEMKFGSNNLRESQKQFRSDVGNAYRWEVCYSWIEAVKAIGDYLGIEEMKELE